MAKLLLTALIIGLLAIGAYFLTSPPPSLPEMDLDKWWGPEDTLANEDTSIRPFKITFPQSVIADLRKRIVEQRPFTPPLDGTSCLYGFNSDQLNAWTRYWADKYNFSEREKFFNQYPQFKTNIQGLDIHFLRITPKVPRNVKLIPMLFLHGWPGSVREFYEAVPLLTAVDKNRDYAIEAIIPSLPGYGYSDAAATPGLGANEVAVVMRNLMHRLGFKKFYVQGGDWGAIIGASMATLFSQEVLGFHSNMAAAMSPLVSLITIAGSLYPPLVVDKEFEDRMYPLKNYYSFLMEETGYMHLQSTKPDTIGVALTDSPAGLLAYILEKFSTWTVTPNKEKEDGGLPHPWTKDQLIDNLMMYWATGSITTSMRLYSETFNKRHQSTKIEMIPTTVPTCIMQSKYELAYQPPWLIKFKFTNLLNATVLQDGGHFIAFEKPEIFAEDVIKSVAEIRIWREKNSS